MRRAIFFLLILLTFSFSQNQYHVYFNEIRADDSGTDDVEFIELIGPAGQELTGFKIIHYNGNDASDGGIWQYSISSFTIPDDGIADDLGTALGFYVVGSAAEVTSDGILPAAIQNGPDGLVLYDALDNIIDAIAWEGAGDMASDDPGGLSSGISVTANNYLHITIDDDALDNSLQAPNNGYADDGSGWLLGAATPGALNFNQVNGDISLPVELVSFTVEGFEKSISVSWRTGSELENAGFIVYRADSPSGDFIALSSYRHNPDLVGLGNSGTGKSYSYSDADPTLKEEIVYYYKIADVDYTGHLNYFGPVAGGLYKPEIFEENPVEFDLHQNYPNPFNPNTIISYQLPDANRVTINIYNALGQTIRILFSGWQVEGFHIISWDGKNSSGIQAASGIYFYSINTGGRILMKKMIKIQ